ncbi:MAG TPA: FKBP-type peptidyl-prolyl cis-trans isomerase [Polyangiaceae bacterium]
MVVALSYVLFDAEGERVEESEPSAPLELLIGYGDAAEALERGIQGLGVGESREVTLSPDEAFGERSPDSIIEVDRADLPEDIAPGDEFEADRENGEGAVLLKVIEVLGDMVVLDTNHPLAGQRVRLSLKIQAIRPASPEELERAAERLLREEEAADVGPLLPAERLLKRGRGESSPAGADEPPQPIPPAPPPKRVA